MAYLSSPCLAKICTLPYPKYIEKLDVNMILGPSEIRLNGGSYGHGEILGYPLTASVSSPFGPRTPFWTPLGWTSDFHNGVDLPAPHGTPIFCPAPGKVAASYFDSAGGQTVVVRFDDGTGAMFIHMEGLQLAQGTVVRRGDIIGVVGTSGLSTGDHLHFSLLTQVRDGISWYAKEEFLNPMTANWSTNPEPPIPPVVDALAYARLIRSYVDQGVPLPAFASMMDSLIVLLEN